MKRIGVWGAGALVVCATSSAALARTEPREPTLGDLRKVGQVELRTSCKPPAQKSFTRGLALLHSFFYDEAKRAFEEAATADASCAMAQWGVAMTYYHPIWAPPDEAALKAGAEAAGKAKALGGKTEIEKGLIAAIVAFYEPPATAPTANAPTVGVPACHGDAKKVPDHGARVKAYGAQMDALYAKQANDVEVAAFYSLSLLGGAIPGDKTLANQKKAAALIEPLLASAKHKNHPGLIHYYIHACDYPSMAKQALEAARTYAAVAPWVPHALHMPSHIFTRLGLWPDSAQSNLASAQAARAYAASHHPDAHSFEELHALDYLVFAYLQTAQDKKADEILALTKTITKTQPQDDMAVAQAQSAIPARLVMERGRWKDAAALEVPTASYFAKFPFTEAYLQYARGVGAARSGQLDVAKKASARLGELKKMITEPRFKIWATHVGFEQLGVDAFIALAEHRDADAEKLLRQAATQEDEVGVHPVSPATILPTRELLGDLLMDLKRPADALKEYDASLAIRPSRFYALAGAARAARAAGDKATAKARSKALVELTKGGDPREELSLANADLR